MDKERIEEERKEFNECKNCIMCEGNPKPGDTQWNIIMKGPKDSPYMGGKFRIRITFPNGYPDNPPKFEFLTKICHININGNTICLKSLANEYNPDSTIAGLLSQIFMLLNNPNQNDAFGTYKQLYIDDYAAYLAKAREMTREYAN